MWRTATREYAYFLYRFPGLILILSILVTVVLPLIGLHFFPVGISPNAEIGFDTADTPYSGQRLAWQRLSYTLAQTNRVKLENATREKEKERAAPPADSTARTARSRRSWGDALLSAFQNVPCYDAPIPLMNHLSQMVIELPSIEHIFEMSFLDKMCQLGPTIAKELAAFDSVTPYRNVWHISNFAACFSPDFAVNCTELNEKAVEHTRNVVMKCAAHREDMVCGAECAASGDKHCECGTVPEACSKQMITDLFYRILPMDLGQTPFHLNTFLPVFTMTGYATQGIGLPLEVYDRLEEAIVKYTDENGIVLKGLLLDVKRDRLVPAATRDSFFSLLSASLVFFCICLHSRSPLYAVAVMATLAMSVMGALGVYSLFSQDFPLLNLVVFVLLIAVGTDDAFLLHSHFPEKLDKDSFHEALSHCGATMFLTSFSTAVPFFVNVMSNVIVFRCFGLFAGATTLINYLLVVTFLPAFMLLQRRYLSCLPDIPNLLRGQRNYIVKELLPSVLVQGRLVWLASLSIVVISAGVICFTELSLPQYNPLQLFTGDNLHEWYDNHAERLFSFVAGKIAMPLSVRLVWGIQPIQSRSTFRPEDVTNLTADPRFSLATVPEVRRLARHLTQIRSLPFVQHEEPFWPEHFLDWSSKYPCEPHFLCCNVSSPLFSNVYLDYCLRNSTSYIFTQYNDTPIFDADNFALVGYTALLPTKLRYSHRFRNLSASMALFDEHLQTDMGGWWTTEWHLMARWFDLQRSIVSDCQYSVIVSLAVVTLFAIVQLRWQGIPAVVCCACVIVCAVGTVVLLGWVVGVLEAVILVLVVGLSFDYTLHYGAAIPSEGCPVHRIRSTAAHASVPVGLAAISSLLAGIAMLFTKTHAFYQVGVFLVVVTCVSWLFSTFLFLPLLSFTLPSRRRCRQCEKEDIPLRGVKY